MNRSTQPVVLLIHPSDELYGADRQLMAVADAISGETRPIVLLPNDLEYRGYLSAALRANGIEVMTGPLGIARRRYASPLGGFRYLLVLIRAYLWTVRLARRHHAKLIVSNSGAVLVGALCAATVGRPHIWCLREIIDRPRWFRGAVRTLGRLPRNRFVVVSQAVSSWLGPVSGRAPGVIYDGVPLADPVAPIQGRPRVLFIGRLNRWKGHEIFMEVAARVHRQIPDSEFVVVGGPVPEDPGGAEAEQLAKAIDPGGEWLVLRGELDDPRDELTAAWVVVVPSTRPDPFPNVVLEAMAAGRPVVGSRSGGIPEMIADGETGVLVTPGDVTGFASSVSELLRDREMVVRMGSAGRDRVTALFGRVRANDLWRRAVLDALGGNDATAWNDPMTRVGTHPVIWDDRKIAEYWDHLAGSDEGEHFGANYAAEVAADIGRYVPRPAWVLDIGCGLGHLVGELSERGYRVLGIDISPATTAAAWARLPQLDESTFRVGSMTDLPVANASVDAVVLTEVVEHILDDAIAPMLLEARRALRRGGRLLVTTPSSERLTDEQVGCPRCGARFHRWQHVRSWTPETLSRVLVENGFVDVKAEARALRGPHRSIRERVRRVVRSAAVGHRRLLRCPDCGLAFARPLGVRVRASWHRRRRKQPHLLVVATRP